MEWKKIGSTVLTNNFVFLALIVVAGIAYLRFAPDSMKPWSSNPTAPAAEAKIPKLVTKIERVYVLGPERVQVIEKIKYVEKMPGVLAPTTAADNASHVIASAEIPPYNGKTIATAILEQKDGVGVGRIETKQLKPPFLQIKKSFGVEGWYYPIGDRQAEASLVANPVRIGPVEIKAKAGAAVMRENSQIRGFVAVGGEWQF